MQLNCLRDKVILTRLALKPQQFPLNWEKEQHIIRMLFRSAQILGASKVANMLHIWRGIANEESGTRHPGMIKLNDIARKK
jgi:hypothetical protein